MPKILAKHLLAPKTHYIKVDSPLIACHAQPGQFVIIRIDEKGERIPLTIADFDPTEGTITLVVQEVGKTSQEIGQLNAGDKIRDLLGPLGTPSEIDHFGNVVMVGGGFGIAAIYPIAKSLRKKENQIYTIIGARTKDLLIMQEPMRTVSDYMTVMTDDGSTGRKGLVTEALDELLREKDFVHRVIAIGPLPMMRAVADLTRPYGIKTYVSLNPIMVDGTGMCGGCRVQIGEETRFACTDGPEFDAHAVNFDELTQRLKMYKNYESKAMEICNLNKKSNRNTLEISGSVLNG